jgi:glyoxylase-like metal-dependent hydrolase (beta-lactamase superfamily II)
VTHNYFWIIWRRLISNTALPVGVTVFERGWLSSNNILICGRESCALVDSGYSTHSSQTLALVASALNGRPLDLLLNTHLHSDHCGGNAALQQVYPDLQTLIPPGHAAFVKDWNPEALTYTPTGQACPQFRFDAVLHSGTEMRLGDTLWQVHAAPGHDPHSVILFEPVSRVLISADALWERGFGVVFPELEGVVAFDEVGLTLDLIETLSPAMVIPGHGSVFTSVAASIAAARARLRSFTENPSWHIVHAAKVLLKFKLLELQSQPHDSLIAWAQATTYFAQIHQKHFQQTDMHAWVGGLIDDLVRVRAATRDGQMIHNAG